MKPWKTSLKIRDEVVSVLKLAFDEGTSVNYLRCGAQNSHESPKLSCKLSFGVLLFDIVFYHFISQQ